MLIFVNNIPLHFIDSTITKSYDLEVDLHNSDIKFGDLHSKVLLKNASYSSIIALMEFLQASKLVRVDSIDVWVSNTNQFKKFIKKELSYVKAAGGVVVNHENKLLFIRRLGVWDLPKGKAENDEKSEETAIREVEEECNITVFSKHRIVSTWHTYFFKGILTLKRTKWYDMGLISDKKMKPQIEEGIEDIQWMEIDKMDNAIENSYLSIQYVIKKWKEKNKIM